MELLKKRGLNVFRYFGRDRFKSRNPICALSVIAIGLVVLCVPITAVAGKIVVSPGESIQAAVDAASPGDTIAVKPGIYTETHGGAAAVSIHKDGIKLVGRSRIRRGKRVILVPGAGNLDGILVKPDPAVVGAPDVDGFRIKGFTVQGFPNNGIKLVHVNNFTILKNESIDNLENGIQPELSANGLVKRNVSYGSDDTALWVEGGQNVRIIGNITHSSVTGIEVTISNDLLIKGNESYNNTVGIGLYHPSASPEPPLAVMKNWHVIGNYVHDNNRPNSAPPGSMSGDLPTGGGILLLGVDYNKIERNTIENNSFYGVAVVDYCLAVDGTSSDCDVVPQLVESRPDYNRIEKNLFFHNGTAPDLTHPMAPYAADITEVTLFSGAAGNCYSANNTYSTFASISGNPPRGCSR